MDSGLAPKWARPGMTGECVADHGRHNHPISGYLPVIASAAKQSRIPPQDQSGLLRRISAKLLRNFVASSSQ
jgi:hypothetical protein